MHNHSFAKVVSIASLSLLVAACAPTTPTNTASSSSSAAAATVTIEASTVTSQPDTNDVSRTKAYLTFSGEVNQQLVLDDTEAGAPLALSYVDPALYSDSAVLAGFSHYYAGGGYNIVVRRTKDSIVIERRATSEGSADEKGGCEPWKKLAEYPVSANTKIEWKNLGAPTTQLVIECEGW